MSWTILLLAGIGYVKKWDYIAEEIAKRKAYMTWVGNKTNNDDEWFYEHRQKKDIQNARKGLDANVKTWRFLYLYISVLRHKNLILSTFIVVVVLFAAIASKRIYYTNILCFMECGKKNHK